MEFDLLIVGAGPAGLATAIQAAKLAKQNQQTISICVLEKGSEVGAHILSGAVLQPDSLNELIPHWHKHTDFHTEVTQDKFYLLSKHLALKLPTPPLMKNDGNYIISLGALCRFLAAQATELGVEIFPGFPAEKLIYDDNDKVIGVQTKTMGIAADGSHKDSYQSGVVIHAKQTILAGGCRDYLTEQVIAKYQLRHKNQIQTYALGVKEVWEIDPKLHQSGLVIHSVGWPLDNSTYGGSFIYHFANNLIAVGLVIGLDYQNPYRDIQRDLQWFKHHPQFVDYFKNGRMISYGARALNEGGYQAIPRLDFPGGLLVGCAAGFVNVPKIKGIHNAIRSGMLAAAQVCKNLDKLTPGTRLENFDQAIRQSKIITEDLYPVRNIRPAFKKGLWLGLAYAAIDTYIFKNKTKWTFKHHSDHQQLKYAEQCTPPDYPKPDGVISFDKLTCLQLANVNHVENQLVHLQLADQATAIRTNWQHYGSPEQYYCPAGVYEIVEQANGDKQLQINSQNCLHCKTCVIKDPTQNITWVPPEGGDGPNYTDM